MIVLPDDSIGVTDILSYRDCARRFQFGMQRHTETGEHPQSTSSSNAYGSSFHDAVAFIAETGASDEEAVQFAISGRFGRWLAPEDIGRMREDLTTYRSRDYYGVEMVASEGEFRVPLMMYKGYQYYYRFRVDRLYRSEANPGTFIHIDYKTSAHPKSKDEIHEDIQISAYAFGLREVFPEIERLVQVYDQLNYGAVPTTRTPEQIELVKEWLIANAITIIEDDDLKPTYNSFCAWCPVIMDCPIIPQLTDYALGEISGLMPKTDDGKVIGQNGEILEGAALEPYVEMLDKVAKARRILDEFDGRVRGTLKEMPIDARLRLGFKTSVPNVSTWPPEALAAILEVLGPEFWQLVTLPKNSITRLPKDTQELINSMAVTHHGAPRMTRVKPPAEGA